ncbi:MAG: hypothetical protein Q9227_006566 [Pyrenula ochraceoflavens]
MANLRRSGPYPIQTSEYTPSIKTPPTSPVKEKKQSLPPSVRALKDSAKADNHGRTLIICLDGTGDRFDNDNSNVVNFVSCLKKHTLGEQVTYYQSGIGTYDKGGLTSGIGAAMDMAVGSGLGTHIKDAYRFLMQNYHENDKICLLGFSRGAYTVRCLVGMLHKVGLLPASNGAQINFAYDFYKDDSPEGWKMSAEFKKTFCTNVNVYFVGLWDCVASVGFIPRKLPFSKSPTNSIRYFRHAMALNEHRSKFKVCQWEHQNPDLKRQNTTDNTLGAQMYRGMERSRMLKLFRHSGRQNTAKEDDKSIDGKKNFLNGHARLLRSETNTDDTQKKLEAYFEALDDTRKKHHKFETDALEVWFMGAHADIGGGAVANETRHMLSRIPLRWMIRQCFECDTGILFDTAGLAQQGLDVHSLWPTYQPQSRPSYGPPPTLMEKYESRKLPPLHWRSLLISAEEDQLDQNEIDAAKSGILSESTEDHFDALAPINDQLTQAKGWWILEVWPVKMRVLAQTGEGWEKRVRMNMGRYRAIRETQPNMHWTVRRMMEEGIYTVKTRADRNTIWQVR